MTTPAYSLALSHPGRPGPHGEGASTPRSPAAATPDFERDFVRLYAERFGPLFRYLDRLTGDAELASDTAQEAFIRLYHRGEVPDEPGAWLVTVAHNHLRDQGRRATRQLRLLEAKAGRVPTASPAVDPAAGLDAGERIRAVRAALDRLSPRDREALLLRHAGYSYREIAVALDLAEGSVGTVLLRAGHQFRHVFKEMHGAPD